VVRRRMMEIIVRVVGKERDIFGKEIIVIFGKDFIWEILFIWDFWE
jgi:hypothetical protein